MNELALQAARLALPLVLATLSEVVAERGGVVNLALEGTMLAGALAAWLVGAGGGGGALAPALLAAVLVGLLVARVQVLFVVRLRADAIVSGTALHFACLGATGLVFERCKRSAGVTTFADLGGVWPLVPWIGTLLVVAVVLGFLFCTRAGLAIRAAGDGPAALRAAGGSPARARTHALLLAGALAGLAGASLTTVLTGTFVEGMTAGRGFLALALVLFARWNPVGALLAGLFLGGMFALELHASTLAATPGGAGALTFALRALPYLLCIAALALVGGRPDAAPRALGRPLEDDR
jgi:simple sugar transport system permease protein